MKDYSPFQVDKKELSNTQSSPVFELGVMQGKCKDNCECKVCEKLKK